MTNFHEEIQPGVYSGEAAAYAVYAALQQLEVEALAQAMYVWNFSELPPKVIGKIVSRRTEPIDLARDVSEHYPTAEIDQQFRVVYYMLGKPMLLVRVALIHIPDKKQMGCWTGIDLVEPPADINWLESPELQEWL